MHAYGIHVQLSYVVDYLHVLQSLTQSLESLL
jgi:hypothetical protein